MGVHKVLPFFGVVVLFFLVGVLGDTAKRVAGAWLQKNSSEQRLSHLLSVPQTPDITIQYSTSQSRLRSYIQREAPQVAKVSKTSCLPSPLLEFPSVQSQTTLIKFNPLIVDTVTRFMDQIWAIDDKTGEKTLIYSALDPNGPAPSAETQAGLVGTVRCVDCLVGNKALHDTFCKAFVKFLEAGPRPTPREDRCYKLGALLPEDSTEPRYVWVEVELLKMETTDGKKLDVHTCYPILPLLPDGIDKRTLMPVDKIRIWRDEKAGFDFVNTLFLWYRDNFLMDGSVQNKYVDKLLEGRRKRYWRGPLLVLSGLVTKTARQFHFMLDVTPSDVQRAGQYFATNGPFADKLPATPLRGLLKDCWSTYGLRGSPTQGPITNGRVTVVPPDFDLNSL
ncbi:hypothetical protein HYFRA_00004995 [Hymenoscyphus fraxineus]|uniref:Uncharacterized protein n=1 Tax=Hymenoscyphus fraxineus TaxID=746836 RepID=A0A9N9KLU7_9HELO|nr:hypothetical protein HYFRA_00004995 [Hymenoscyphus fraxineus]